MRIVTSDVNLASSHSLLEKDVKQQSLKVWGMSGQGKTSSLTASLAENMHKEFVEISQQGRDMLKAKLRDLQQTKQTEEQPDLSETDPKIHLLETLLSALTGKEIKINVIDLSKLRRNSDEMSQRMAEAQANQDSASVNGSVGWGISFNSYEAHMEKETTTFSAGGNIKTADGRELNFALDLSMSRQYVEENRISFKAGDALKDPLVINFGAPAATLTEKKYDFDLDNDGSADKISFVGSGSGFLALDSNNDGIINNGSELFGPESGNGFADLARFDADGNNWIDEGDEVYAKLRIWTKDENGQNKLMSLKEANVGAIYLGNVNSAFSLKNSQNQLMGQVHASGIFLREDGLAGTVQQVDLAV